MARYKQEAVKAHIFPSLIFFFFFETDYNKNPDVAGFYDLFLLCNKAEQSMGSNKAINGTMLGKKLVYSSSVTLRFPWSVTRGCVGGGDKV